MDKIGYYDLIDYNDLFEWVNIRWEIMKIIISSKYNFESVTDRIKSTKFTDKRYQEYELEYVKFLTLLYDDNSPVRQVYNDKFIDVYLTSLRRDMNGLLYHSDDKIKFYGYENLSLPISRELLVNIITGISFKINNLLSGNKNNQDEQDNKIEFLRPLIEDTFYSYRSNLTRLAPTIEYSREIKHGNINILPIYLLEVHIRNIIALNIDVGNIYESYNRFLSLHLESLNPPLPVDIVKEIVDDMKELILILSMSTKNNKSGDLISYYKQSKNNMEYLNINANIISLINVLLAAGKMPINISTTALKSEYDYIIKSLPTFSRLRKNNIYFCDIFDIELLQFPESLFNASLPSVIFDYKLVNPAFNDLTSVLETAKSKKPNNDNSVLSRIDRQFYEISWAQSTKGLLIRSKLLTYLSILAKSKY